MNAAVRARACALTFLLGLSGLALPAPAQWLCDGRGAVLRPASVEVGPALGCAYAPDAPGFRLFAPEFHDIAARDGWRLVAARARPRLIVRYRCTGLWLLPVVPRELAIYGHVLDVTAAPCDAMTAR